MFAFSSCNCSMSLDSLAVLGKPSDGTVDPVPMRGKITGDSVTFRKSSGAPPKGDSSASFPLLKKALLRNFSPEGLQKFVLALSQCSQRCSDSRSPTSQSSSLHLALGVLTLV